MSKYYEVKAVSQSQLTNLSYGPKYYKNNLEKEQIDSDAMTIGSLVDCLITEPEAFNQSYYVATKSKPTAQLGIFIDELWKRYNPDSAELPFLDAYEALKEINGGKLQKSLESFTEYFKESGMDYYNQLVAGIGRRTVTPEQYETAKKVVESLNTNEFTRMELQAPQQGEILFQLEIYWEYVSLVDHESTQCKSKLDVVTIDHFNNIIYPKDIKVKMESAGEFYSSFLKFRYDLQAAFYRDAIEWWALQKGLSNKNGKLYTIAPFRFIVESAKYPGTPLIFECSKNDLYCGKHGGYIRGRYYKGYIELIEDLKWYEKNNRFDYEKKVIEANGIIITDVYDTEE